VTETFVRVVSGKASPLMHIHHCTGEHPFSRCKWCLIGGARSIINVHKGHTFISEEYKL